MMTVSSFILRKGVAKAAKKYGPKLIKEAKAYIKKNKLILSGNKVIKPPKGSVKKIKGGKGGPAKKKINANKNEGKPNKPKDNKPKDNKPKDNKPKPNKPKDNKSKSFVGKGAAIGGGLLVGAAIIKSKNKDKKTETKKTTGSNAPGGKSSSTKANAPGGVTMDDMLVKKDVQGPSKKFLEKTSKPKVKGQFGSNISFTSKDVKTLRENAKMLKKQIDGLDITNFQKLRLKKVVDTRDKNFSMDESYRKAFNEVKRRVKDNKLNFAIDVSGYAGNRKD